MDRVQIVEVGPRDGFQSIGPFIPTATKIEIVEALAASGVTRMEVGSFVSLTALPQMADIRAVLDAANRLPLLTPAVLVPNLRGAELALAAGARHLVTVVSASESHNQANTRRAVGASLDEFRNVLRIAPRDSIIRFNIATSFHCPFEGVVDAARVIAIIEAALSARSDIEIGLCDTVGKAMPHEVKALFGTCMEAFPKGCTWAFHAHDTFGFGVANVLAAYEAGIRVMDSAVAGLGGCPFAPGASGNIATEDIVHAFGRMGISHGVDLETLFEAADRVLILPGAVTGGHVRNALGRTSSKLGRG